MGAEVIILANPYTYNFLKGLTHSAVITSENREAKETKTGETSEPQTN